MGKLVYLDDYRPAPAVEKWAAHCVTCRQECYGTFAQVQAWRSHHDSGFCNGDVAAYVDPNTVRRRR